jgi:propionyl-CoA carboxylase alpha chain
MNENNDSFRLLIDDTNYVTNVTAKYKLRKKYVAPDPLKLLAFIPGTIREIFVSPGQSVKEGQSLLILEAMKMRNDVKAQKNYTIKAIHVKSGENVMKNQIILEFE